MSTIKICSNHEEYQVPLLWTFAFRGAEFWCPFCGRSEGMLGAGEDVEETEDLIKRREIYKTRTAVYLDAIGTEICASLMYEGERISPEELPQEEKDRLSIIRKTGWTKFLPAEGEETLTVKA